MVLLFDISQPVIVRLSIIYSLSTFFLKLNFSKSGIMIILFTAGSWEPRIQDLEA